MKNLIIASLVKEHIDAGYSMEEICDSEEFDILMKFIKDSKVIKPVESNELRYRVLGFSPKLDENWFTTEISINIETGIGEWLKCEKVYNSEEEARTAFSM